MSFTSGTLSKGKAYEAVDGEMRSTRYGVLNCSLSKRGSEPSRVKQHLIPSDGA
jgi:hypothetical protein